MTILTFLAILALITFAAALLLAVNLLTFEYSTSRALDIQAAALQTWFSDDDDDDEEDDETESTILDYSSLPSTGF